ncbi:hypothetical protein [Streptomyces sp. NPDC047968]|uniref:hypothetical protein n=1 Tax=Streptomyces sp. NPDC047968 TaxID=3155382 RepID=UPI0034159B47
MAAAVLHQRLRGFFSLKARANLFDLFDRGGFRALDKGSVDSASAVVILESWFERQLG